MTNEMRVMRYWMYEMVKQLAFGRSLAASDLVERGMKLLGVKDLSAEHLEEKCQS